MAVVNTINIVNAGTLLVALTSSTTLLDRRCEVDFFLSVPGRAQGGSVDRKHWLGQIGGKWVCRSGQIRQKGLETDKNS